MIKIVDKLPPQLKWAQFVKVLGKLDYELEKNSSGSARTFVSKTRSPSVVTFHEPHGSDPIRPGTLRENLRKLNIDRDRFFELLGDRSRLQVSEAGADEDRYTRYTQGGIVTSLCNKCFATVIQSPHEEEIDLAEAAHPCFAPETA